MIKILFVSHEASVTGAPLSLLKIITYIIGLNSFDIKILIRSEGILEKEFRSLAPTKVYYKKVVKKNLLSKISYNIFRRKHAGEIKRKLLKTWHPNIMYANTACNGEIMQLANTYGIPVIAHIRELIGEIKTMNKKDIRRLVTIPIHYIAISEAVKNDLTGKLSIPPEKITLVNNFVDVDTIKLSANEIQPSELKKKLNIPLNSFIVGCSGKISKRKGVDYFIKVARKLVKLLSGKPIQFIWVGGPLHEVFAKEIIEHVDKDAVLRNKIILTGAQKNPYPYYKIFDVFMLTSREEPFGNVVVEAGSLEKPFVCFEEAGGPKEFVKGGWGFAIRNFDLDNMAEKIQELLLNPKLRKEMGKLAEQRVRESYTAEQAMPKILSLISRFTSSNNMTGNQLCAE